MPPLSMFLSQEYSHTIICMPFLDILSMLWAHPHAGIYCLCFTFCSDPCYVRVSNLIGENILANMEEVMRTADWLGGGDQFPIDLLHGKLITALLSLVRSTTSS